MKKRFTVIFPALILCLRLCLSPASANSMGQVGTAPRLAAGDYTVNVSAVIDDNGSLWMWGLNNYGQLGFEGSDAEVKWSDKVFPAQTVPVKVMDNVKAVSVSEDFTAVIKPDDSLWMWGRNDCGQLGNGTTVDSRIPVKVMDDVAAVSLGGSSVAAIKADGTLWVWGYDCTKQSRDYTVKTPVKVMDNVKAVSAGGFHFAAIKTNGSLWTWGSNYRGALGTGNPATDINYTQITPVKVMDNVKAVSTTSWFTAALKDDGSVWTWGDNTFNMLGNDQRGTKMDAKGNLIYQNKPVKVMDGAESISVGRTFVAAIKADQSLWTWGYNSYEQLGDRGAGNYIDHGLTFQTIPVRVMNHVAEVCAGDMDALALDADGNIWAWGFNSYGQIEGLDMDDKGRAKVVLPDSDKPAVLPDPTAFTDVAAGTWYAPPVDWAVSKGITNGTEKGKFSPTQNCTHAQILTFLYRADQGQGKADPADMDKAVTWAREKGMIDASFDGSKPCTRADAVNYIWQALGKESAKASSFTDVDPNAAYAKAVDWAVANGVTNGTNAAQTEFSPNQVCTRGHIVTFLHRAYVPEARLK